MSLIRRILGACNNTNFWRYFLGCILTLFFNTSFAQTGPGGVGTSDGTSTLSVWFRPDNGVSTTGTSVNSWVNSAGITALNITESGTNRPTLVAGAVNGYSEISFNGSNKLTTAVGAMTTTNFVTNQASSFVVNRADNTTQSSCVYTTDPLEVNRFSNHIPWSASVYFDIGDCCNDRINVGALTGLNNYSVWSYDAINSATGKQLYRNGTQVQTVGISTLTYNSHATHRFNLGGFTGGTNGFEGDIAEVIIFRSKVNSAQRLIVQNYLSAKYNIALTANDLYTQDGSGYDHDVAGIGRANSVANSHADSRGTGIVRVLNPSNLNNNEYFFWGHDNGALTSQTTDLPAGIQGRLTRVWAGQTVGDLNDADIEFDLTGLGSVTAGDLRLLIDTDAIFLSGSIIVSGAVAQGGNVYRFINVADIVGNGSTNAVLRFTLGTVNITQTPLPITLLSFNAVVDGSNEVKLAWKTSQEINNEFFTIERSANGLDWTEVKTGPGKGNSIVLQSYLEYDDNPLWGISYYRLKQTDFDGKFTYSRVVSVTVTKSFHDIEVFPIPATNEVFIQYPPAESIVIRLFDQMGREQVIFPMEGQQGATLDISDLSSGIYFIHLSNGTLDTYRKIVKE